LIFIDKKTFFKIEIGYILIDLNYVFPIKQSELNNSIPNSSYDEKITEIATLLKSAQFPKYRYRSKILIAQIEDMNKDRLKILRPNLLYFAINKLSKSVTVGLGRLIVLNDSAGPKMVMKEYFNCFQRFLLLFECRRGDPYKTASNRNFVRFAHS